MCCCSFIVNFNFLLKTNYLVSTLVKRNKIIPFQITSEKWFEAIECGNIDYISKNVSTFKCLRDEDDMTALMKLVLHRS